MTKKRVCTFGIEVDFENRVFSIGAATPPDDSPQELRDFLSECVIKFGDAHDEFDPAKKEILRNYWKGLE